jgi:folate-binding protein YgfZ
MNTQELEIYKAIRENETGFYEQKRGLIAVWGKEAVQFLNGLITNDIGKIEDGAKMPAAFPNAQGRLLATVRISRQNDRFLFETEASTREKIFQNLFRFTYAGDFFVEDLSDDFKYFETLNFKTQNAKSAVEFDGKFVPNAAVEDFLSDLKKENAREISDALYEVLRIENGVPKYGVDMDETTIVPELGIDGIISYNKGCYIGQEIIARIHFRGHVAKQLTGLVFEDENAEVKPNDEIKSDADKNAGRVTSVCFSPKLGKTIALAYVRYDYLAEGTKLKVGDFAATVKNLPFIG